MYYRYIGNKRGFSEKKKPVARLRDWFAGKTIIYLRTNLGNFFYDRKRKKQIGPTRALPRNLLQPCTGLQRGYLHIHFKWLRRYIMRAQCIRTARTYLYLRGYRGLFTLNERRQVLFSKIPTIIYIFNYIIYILYVDDRNNFVSGASRGTNWCDRTLFACCCAWCFSFIIQSRYCFWSKYTILYYGGGGGKVTAIHDVQRAHLNDSQPCKQKLKGWTAAF